MAVLPLLVDLAETLSEPSIFDDDFGFGVHPYELSHYNRPRGIFMTLPKRRPTPYSICKRKVARTKDVPNVGKDGFQVCMHVEEFMPSELTVKTVDNCVVVEGKHEEREDGHGSISRHFVRKYSLPKGYDPSEVVSTLSSDGVLTVKAPPPPKKDSKQKERVIQIQHTGPAHLSVKDNSTESHNPVANGDKAGDNMES